MPPIVLDSIEALQPLIGKEVAVSDWLLITQRQIDAFAEATGDRQWIHTDPIRAAKESPFGTTITHGFLTLSLLPQLLSASIQFSAARMEVNYGLNKLRFPNVVRANTRVRAHFILQSVEQIKEGVVQLVWGVTMECEGVEKPCLIAEWLIRVNK